MASTSLMSQKQIDSQNNAWLMYFGNHRLNDKFSVHTEYQFRRHEFLNDWQQSLARVGLDYWITNKAIATG